MSEFEFLLSLFGLLLGFTLVEVLSGLVTATKTLRTPGSKSAVHIKVGWLTPILALFVILDISSYWVNIWWIRETLPVGLDTIFGGLIVAGAYYFAASMIFPDDIREWPELDEWFWLHRRQVIGPLFIVNAIWVTTIYVLYPSNLELGVPWERLIPQIAFFGLLGAAFVAQRTWVVATALGLISFLYLIFGVMEFAFRLG